MSSKVHSITEAAAQLERQERVAIIEKLLEGLELESTEDPSEMEKAWSNEVRRRSNDLSSGDAKSVPWDQERAEGEKLFDGD